MRIRITVFSLILLFSTALMTGCQFPGSQPALSPEDMAKTIVAETSAPISAMETMVAETLAAKGENGADTTVTPTVTQSEPATPTTAFTSTLSVPMVQVSVNTNCRTGPGKIFDWVSSLLVGQQAEVIARNADGTYWVIRNPGGSGNCWLWGFYANVQGPTAGLPVWDSPPTPTPDVTDTPQPTTYKTMSLDINQTGTADLDEGVLAAGAASDLWFQAVTAAERYLTPRNGAKMVIWGSSAAGMYDCIGAALSTNSIPIADVPVGTYVCYETNQGRPGAFRVNALAGTVLSIGFTTWNAP